MLVDPGSTLRLVWESKVLTALQGSLQQLKGIYRALKEQSNDHIVEGCCGAQLVLLILGIFRLELCSVAMANALSETGVFFYYQ
jgi:hypothetical protein